MTTKTIQTPQQKKFLTYYMVFLIGIGIYEIFNGMSKIYDGESGINISLMIGGGAVAVFFGIIAIGINLTKKN